MLPIHSITSDITTGLGNFALLSNLHSSESENLGSSELNLEHGLEAAKESAETLDKNNIRVVVSNKAMKKKRSVWRTDIQHALKNTGRQYIGTRRDRFGKKVAVKKPAKSVRPACAARNRCRKSNKYKCSAFNVKARQMICQKFWKGGGQRRKEFLLKYIKSRDGNEHLVTTSSLSSYYLPLGTHSLKVCSKMFTATLNINRTFIHRMLKLGTTDIVLKPILTKPADDKENQLKQFLKKLPCLPSHYNRLNSTKKYLQRDIDSIASLYSEYKATEEAAGRQPYGKSKFYEKFRESEFQLYVPLKDRCEACQVLEKEVENGKEGALDKLTEHRNQVSKVFICFVLSHGI